MQAKRDVGEMIQTLSKFFKFFYMIFGNTETSVADQVRSFLYTVLDHVSFLTQAKRETGETIPTTASEFITILSKSLLQRNATTTLRTRVHQMWCLKGVQSQKENSISCPQKKLIEARASSTRARPYKLNFPRSLF